jgi:hypothetical protein
VASGRRRLLPVRLSDPPRLYLERGRPVLVLLAWSGKGPRNVLVEREDGSRAVRGFRGLRRPGVDRA